MHDMKQSLFPQHDHDHSDCTSNLMRYADRYCKETGLRLTKLRRTVLEKIAANHKAIGAYQILDKLAAEGQKLAPISVYRSLEFLQDAGLIHRLESSNSYFACQRSFEDEVTDLSSIPLNKCCEASPLVFLICEDCGVIAEVEGALIKTFIETVVASEKFDVKRSQLEIKGTCVTCQTSS
jgi:Fur family zinc uptake transcriptional regulator